MLVGSAVGVGRGVLVGAVVAVTVGEGKISPFPIAVVVEVSVGTVVGGDVGVGPNVGVA